MKTSTPAINVIVKLYLCFLDAHFVDNKTIVGNNITDNTIIKKHSFLFTPNT